MPGPAWRPLLRTPRVAQVVRGRRVVFHNFQYEGKKERLVLYRAHIRPTGSSRTLISISSHRKQLGRHCAGLSLSAPSERDQTHIAQSCRTCARSNHGRPSEPGHRTMERRYRQRWRRPRSWSQRHWRRRRWPRWPPKPASYLVNVCFPGGVDPLALLLWVAGFNSGCCDASPLLYFALGIMWRAPQGNISFRVWG